VSVRSGHKFKSRLLVSCGGTARIRFPSHQAILRALNLLTISASWIIIAGQIESVFGNPGGITNIFKPLSQPAQEIEEWLRRSRSAA